MDTDVFKKPFDIIKKEEYQWLIVQYDDGPHKFIRKIVRSNEVILSINFLIQPVKNSAQYEDQVLIRDNEQIFIGYIIYKASDEKEALYKNKLLQTLSRQMFYSSYEFNAIVDHLYFNHHFWLLIMYTTDIITTENGEQDVVGIFHKNQVILKRDHQYNNIVAFVQEAHSTQKGVVLRVTNDLADLIIKFDIIKYHVVKQFKAIILKEKKTQEFHEEMNKIEQKLYKECNRLTKTLQAADKKKNSARRRVFYLKQLFAYNNVWAKRARLRLN